MNDEVKASVFYFIVAAFNVSRSSFGEVVGDV